MVEFVIRVPDDTPPWQPVYLAGDGPLLRGWSADGVRLDRHDDGTHRAVLPLPLGWRGRFLVTLGRWRDAENDGRGRELAPRELNVDGPAAVEVEVAGWGRGGVRHHPDFPSEYLPSTRPLSVWVPPGYDLHPARRHPVLYLQDGQNLFDPRLAFGGHPWWADEVAEREIRAGRVRPLILVGVWNTADRLREYAPRRDGGRTGDADWSREYGRFLVEEVKPFVDTRYRTLPGPDHTGVGGSSMGGLISLQLCQWYPAVFGRCAALSPSLWWDREFFLHHLHAMPEWLGRCRVWLDMGTREGHTEEAMSAGADRAKRLAAQLVRRGMRPGDGLGFEIVEGGTHDEGAWGARLDRVLRFLFPAEG
jgi:predicted alpha/beta superfamily hydrolase